MTPFSRVCSGGSGRVSQECSVASVAAACGGIEAPWPHLEDLDVNILQITVMIEVYASAV